VKRVVPSVIGLLLVGGVVVDLALNGFAWGYACDAGFGQRQKAEQERYLHLLDLLPRTIELQSFQCSGFQDLEVRTVLRTSAADGQQLLSRLNARFESRQDDQYVPDVNKRRTQWTSAQGTQASFYLPSPRKGFHGMEVKLTVPASAAEQAVVELALFQW
jgi:hypothetical protein